MTDAARLAAPGFPITLVTGQVVHCRYGMAALMRLEDRFGGLAAMQSAISLDGSGPMIGPAVALIAAGLSHEHNGEGAPLSNPDLLADLLDPSQLETYLAAAGLALQQAFPAGKAGTPGEAQAAPAASPSMTGTTPSL